MPKTLSPSDRMHVRNIGELMHPGACCVCGSGTCQQGYIDIGVYYDYEGQVYLCMACLTEAAETAGMLSIPESEHLISLNKELAEKNTQLKADLEKASEENERFNDLLRPIAERSLTDGIIASSVSVSETEQSDGDTTEGNDEPTDVVSDERESNESVVTEPVTEPVRLERASRSTSGDLKL